MPHRSPAVLALAFAIAGCGGRAAPPPPTAPDMAVAPNACAYCGAPALCCSEVCVNVQSDKNNCGDCGRVCAAGTFCQGGSCLCEGSKAPCGGGQSCCGASGCKSLDNDAQNCGACGHACTVGQTCDNGACTDAPDCVGCAHACCSRNCVDTTSDASNCGACGMACGPNQTCESGACTDGHMMQPGDGGSCECAHKCLLSCVAGCCVEDVLTGACKTDQQCPGLPG